MTGLFSHLPAYSVREGDFYMEIYVVKSGDTLFAVAERYGVDAAVLAQNNGVTDPERLVPGQTLVILYPARTHTVRAGETLTGVARQFGVPVDQLLRNNPVLEGLPAIFPDQVLVIDYVGEKRGEMAVNGYVYPYVQEDVLRRTLPYLTYLTVFTYGFRADGTLIPPDGDARVTALAVEYGVAPLLLLSTLDETGRFSNARSTALLSDRGLWGTLADNLIAAMREKGYEGLDIDFEYVQPAEREDYAAFIGEMTARMAAAGYFVSVSLAPKVADDQPGLLYEAHDYAALGAAADAVLLMTYEWGYTYGPAMAVAPLDKVKRVLDYAVTRIDPRKIFMGVPNYGYDFALPYVAGESKARSLSNAAAVELAAEVRADIDFDPRAQAPFFNYKADGVTHEVWFEDARSIEGKLSQVPAYGFRGVSYWNLMRWFPQNWLVLNALYRIARVG